MNAERWRRLHALLEDAMALPQPERAGFLDRSCPDAQDRRYLEELLSHHDSDADFLEDGAGRLAAEWLTDGELMPGDVLGPYRITRELGRGGMGVVYLARDTRLDRNVAIKMLPQDVSQDARWRNRLRQEARAAAAVSHAGVAHVYAFEENDRGAGFLVSEYVPGHTLREEVEKGPLDPATAIDTARQIAAAAAAAHARGIVHRDLKPENVMRTPDGVVKVLDFGLARMIEPVLGESKRPPTLTRAGMGTPGYMAPEQLRGVETGPATDVFALGLMLHEMLSGRHPFATEPGRESAIVVRILEEAPAPLPSRLVQGMPGIDEVVDRCLQKRPEDRYPSMDALAVELEALAAGTPRVPSKRPSSDLRAAQGGSAAMDWWQFHQLAVCVVYVAMIYPAWLVRGSPVPKQLHGLLFVAMIVAAALSTTLRLNLVFTARVHRERLGGARRLAGPWTRGFDWVMTLALLAMSALGLVGDRVWLAALFGAVAASATTAFLLIEPATADATLGEHS